MQYKNMDYVNARQEDEVLSGTLHTNRLVSLAEDENRCIMGMTGPEYVEIDTGEERIRVKGCDILTPLEALRMRQNQ